MSQVVLDSWVRHGRATGYLHPQARLLVVRADPPKSSGSSPCTMCRAYGTTAARG